ncbi:MAG: hypothetical protein ACOCYT_04525 [Chloroflexota bacterium]
MSATYDKLKALLDEKKSITQEEIDQAIAEHGAMTDEEVIQLEADRLEAAKSQTTNEAVTLEQYLEAVKTLDTAEEGSETFKKAETIVQKYEAGT